MMMKTRNVVFLSLFILFLLLIRTSFVFARGPVPGTPEAAGAGNVCQFATSDLSCSSCMSDGKHVWTAIGCLPTDSGVFITTLLSIGSGIAGGIAFLLIIIGGFQIITSAGNPERLNEGKEVVVSAIVGLLFVVFSVFLLRLIGFDILRIPGFS